MTLLPVLERVGLSEPDIFPLSTGGLELTWWDEAGEEANSLTIEP